MTETGTTVTIYPYTINSTSQQPPKHCYKYNNSLISINCIVPPTAVVLWIAEYFFTVGQISYFEKLSNVLLYCFHRLERRSPGSRKQYGLVIDGASLSLVFKGPYTGKSIVFVWMNSHISSSLMAAFKEARYRTRLCTYRNIIYTYERLCCRWFFLWTLHGTVHHWDNFSLVFLIRTSHVHQAQCHRDIHTYTYTSFSLEFRVAYRS